MLYKWNSEIIIIIIIIIIIKKNNNNNNNNNNKIFYSSDKNTYSVSYITLKCKEASVKYCKRNKNSKI